MPHPCCRLQSAASRSAPSAGAPGIQRPKVFHLNVLPQLSQPAGEAPTATFQGASEANWPWPPQKFTVLSVTSLWRNMAKHGENRPQEKKTEASQSFRPWRVFGDFTALGSWSHHVSSSRWNLRQRCILVHVPKGWFAPNHFTIPQKNHQYGPETNAATHHVHSASQPEDGLFHSWQMKSNWFLQVFSAWGIQGMATAVWTTMVCFLVFSVGNKMSPRIKIETDTASLVLKFAPPLFSLNMLWALNIDPWLVPIKLPFRIRPFSPDPAKPWSCSPRSSQHLVLGSGSYFYGYNHGETTTISLI